MEEQGFELSLELQGHYRFLVDFGRDDLPPLAWAGTTSSRWSAKTLPESARLPFCIKLISRATVAWFHPSASEISCCE